MHCTSPIRRALYTLLLGLALGATGCSTSQPYLETEKQHSWLSFNRPAYHEAGPQLQHADNLRAHGSLRRAANAYKALVTTWPASPEAPVAQLRLAVVQEQRGKIEKAFDEYDFLMKRYFGSFPYDDVLEHEFAIANKVMDKRRGRLLLFGGFKAPERAVPLFEKVVENGPRWDRAPEAQFMVGKANELASEYELAVVAYMTCLHRYPDSPYAEKAAFGRAHCLYVVADDSPNDEEALEQAWAAVVMYLNTYPTGEQREVATAYRDSLLRRRAETAYQKAVFYDKLAKKPDAALQSYRQFVQFFPNSEWTSLAQARIDALSRSVERTP